MALAHYSKVFAVLQLQIAKLTADPVGGPATYGATVQIIGSKALSIAGTILTKFLRGDNTLLDSDSVIQDMTATFNYAKLNLDALSVMYSTLTVDSGTTPNQNVNWGFKNTDVLQYFKIEGRAASADFVSGDVKFSLWKCKLSAPPVMGLTEEDYTLPNSSVTVMPRIADGKWLDINFRETAAALT